MSTESRSVMWGHLSALYAREASLLGATTATGAIAVALIGLSVDLVRDSSEDLGILALLAPIAPPVLLGVFLFVYLQSQMTGSYIRRIEHVLRNGEGGEPVTGFVPGIGRVRFPFYSSLISALFARSRGNGVYRAAFTLLGWVTVSFIAGGSVLLSLALAEVDEAYSWSPVLVGVLLALDFLVYFGGIARRSRIYQDAHEVDARRFEVQVDPAWLVAKIVVPRGSSLGKALWIVAGFVVGLGLVRFEVMPQVWLDALLTVTIFEFLVYQARYLVNDLRDWRIDLKSPDPAVARRLPDSLGPHKLLLLSVSVVARLWLAGALIRFVSEELRGPLVVVIVALVSVTLLYETAREFLRKPKSDVVSTSTRWWTWVVLLTVPLGYVLRFGLGLMAVNASSDIPVWIMVMFAISAYAANFGSVHMGWILASMPSVDVESGTIDQALAEMPHRVILDQKAGLLPSDREVHVVDMSMAEVNQRYLYKPIDDARFTSSRFFQVGVFGSITVAGLLSAVAGLAAGSGLTADEQPWFYFMAVVLGVVLASGTSVTINRWLKKSNEDSIRPRPLVAAARRALVPTAVLLAAALTAGPILIGAGSIDLGSSFETARNSLTELIRGSDLAWFVSLASGLVVGFVSIRTMYTDIRATVLSNLNELRLRSYIIRRGTILFLRYLATLPAAVLRGSFDVYRGDMEADAPTIGEAHAARLARAIAESRESGRQAAEILSRGPDPIVRDGAIYGFIEKGEHDTS